MHEMKTGFEAGFATSVGTPEVVEVERDGKRVQDPFNDVQVAVVDAGELNVALNYIAI